MSKRDEIQAAALAAAAGKRRSGLALSMGVGKTLIGLKHMDQLYQDGMRAFLVVAPKRSIFQSWKDDAAKFDMKHLLNHITFTTYLSLNKQDANGYDAVYLDECHSLLYTHEFWLTGCSGIILGLTGTPPRFPKSEKGYMVGKFCPIAYKYITDDAVEDAILNDYRVVIHALKLDSRSNVPVEMKGRSFFTSEQKNYEYWSNRIANAVHPGDMQITRIMRMKAMMGFPSKTEYAKQLLHSMQDKCLVFCNTQDQADQVYPYSYHSNNPYSEHNLDMFKVGEIDKLSCVQQLSEGVNIPHLRSCIILHAYSNERKSAQRIGRVLRLNPDDTATVHILMYQGTIDEAWVRNALEDLDPSKISYVDANEYRGN